MIWPTVRCRSGSTLLAEAAAGKRVGLRAELGHLLEGVALVARVTLGDFHEILNQIEPAFEFHFDVRPRLIDGVAGLHQGIVGEHDTRR